MTTEELNTIVQAVIDKINKQVIDFDVVSSTPASTDLLSAVRSQGDGTYQGVTLKWDDVANVVTREAKGYRDEAASAKTNVENMKASVEQTVSNFNTLAEEKKAEVQGVYQTDLNELKGDLDNRKLEKANDRVYIGNIVDNKWQQDNGNEYSISYGFYLSANVQPNTKYYATGTHINNSFPLVVMFDENNNVIGTKELGQSIAEYDYEFVTPSNCVKVSVN